MYGYRDHCIRTADPAQRFSCPYFMDQVLCPHCSYRQKAEEYPAHFQKRPENPPPSYTPSLSSATLLTTGGNEFAILSPCIYKYTYVWLNNGQSFWSYIVFVGKKAVSGWRYRGGRWVQFGMKFKEIHGFTCS